MTVATTTTAPKGMAQMMRDNARYTGQTLSATSTPRKPRRTTRRSRKAIKTNEQHAATVPATQLA